MSLHVSVCVCVSEECVCVCMSCWRACVPACVCVCVSVDAMKKLISSFILSRLNYSNSLLAGLPENNRLDRLQRVQNNAARLVLGRQGPRCLHWFPVRAGIEYKISTLC